MEHQSIRALNSKKGLRFSRSRKSSYCVYVLKFTKMTILLPQNISYCRSFFIRMFCEMNAIVFFTCMESSNLAPTLELGTNCKR